MFLFGAALGSFIAVIADRFNTGLSFLKGRSVCFSCNTELRSKDLFPFFSFIFLKGKCRYCGSKIPKETFIVELLMGFLSILAFLKSGLFISDFSSIIHNSYFLIHFSLLSVISYLLLVLIFGAILLISVYDLKHFIIPDSFLIFLSIFSFIYILISNFSIFPSFLSGIVLALPFLLIFLISRGTWFGFGDVKYILVLGFLLGFVQGISAIVLAFWIGAIVSVAVILLQKIAPKINLPLLRNNLTIKSEIPFGPFLSLGVVISLFLSLDLFHIYDLFF
jgi:leader peptidase (prepilin peptidase) / N-methyltransferase